MEHTEWGVFLAGVISGFLFFWLPFIVTQIFSFFESKHKSNKTGVNHVTKDNNNQGE